MIDKSLFLIGWLSMSVAVAKLAPVTSLVYSPESVAMEGVQVTVTRTFPMDVFHLPRPRIAYIETVRPLTITHNDGLSCTKAGGPFPYNRATPVGQWKIAWAKNCISDPLGYEWEARWFWHLGSFEFGPTKLNRTFIKAQ